MHVYLLPSDWDATLNSIRRGETNARSIIFVKNDENSDSDCKNKTSDKISSTKHITLAKPWSDVSTLQNRDVSVNYLPPVRVLDLESGLNAPSNNIVNNLGSKKKKYDLAAARRRRHTVSRIEYSSPFQPISEANEDKHAQVNDF